MLGQNDVVNGVRTTKKVCLATIVNGGRTMPGAEDIDTPESIPSRILLWIVGAVLLGTITCRVNIRTSPSVHDDANSVGITSTYLTLPQDLPLSIEDSEFGKVYRYPDCTIIVAPDGAVIGKAYRF